MANPYGVRHPEYRTPYYAPPIYDFTRKSSVDNFLPSFETITWEPSYWMYRLPNRRIRFRRVWVPTRGPFDQMEPRELDLVSKQVNDMARNEGWAVEWELDYQVLEHFMAEAWIYWCSTTSATSTSSTTSNGTWEAWCGLDSTASSTTSSNSDTVWVRWTAAYPPPEPTERTAEQQAEFEANRNRIEAERRAKQEQKKEADRKAIELLRSQLDEEQLANYDLDGSFVVIAGRKRYRLRGASVHEVDKNGKELASYCIHPSYKENIPMGDTILAKKLLLDAAPKEFEKIANRTPVRF